MAPSKLNPADYFKGGVASFTVAQPLEFGGVDSHFPYNSEKAEQELVQQTPITGSRDDHLIEFSEALKTVAKALRQAAEVKASAQAEAAEWKRRYEIERARNLRLEHREQPSSNCNGNVANGNIENLSGQSVVGNERVEGSKSCSANGICSHEILRDGAADSNSISAPNKMMRKSREVVDTIKDFMFQKLRQLNDYSTWSKEENDVNRAYLKQASFKLCWRSSGISDQHKHDIVSFEKGNITTAERSSKQISLTWESNPHTVLIMTKPNSSSVRILCAEMVRWLKEDKSLNIYVEPRVRSDLLAESSHFSFVQTWKDDREIMLLHNKVDLVITLGGDGTVLWAASMFKGPVPLIVPFSLGSLGFMTPFYSEQYRDCLNSILRGPISITLRHRLQCHIIRDSAKSECETDEPFLVLNEVTIDRGISSFLTNLECYCDDSFVTCVQGDGLILSTTSGSTAYSLAAGGSMVHPQVPGILFTPICPHSLSFRPLIMPEHVTIRIQVPFNSRSPAWASFDGKDRKQLAAGDALVCSMAPWPVPTACQADSTSDFLHSIHDGLHWNLRKTQSFDGPHQ